MNETALHDEQPGYLALHYARVVRLYESMVADVVMKKPNNTTNPAHDSRPRLALMNTPFLKIVKHMQA